MTYAHCVMAAAIPEGADEKLADALLDVISTHPLAGQGVYVISLFETEALAVSVSRFALNAGVDAAFHQSASAA